MAGSVILLFFLVFVFFFFFFRSVSLQPGVFSYEKGL